MTSEIAQFSPGIVVPVGKNEPFELPLSHKAKCPAESLVTSQIHNSVQAEPP